VPGAGAAHYPINLVADAIAFVFGAAASGGHDRSARRTDRADARALT
jgi:hypothetical protein